jgi:hypothetical protein
VSDAQQGGARNVRRCEIDPGPIDPDDDDDPRGDPDEDDDDADHEERDDPDGDDSWVSDR